MALLAVVGLEAPVLASYSQQNINIFNKVRSIMLMLIIIQIPKLLKNLK